MLNQLLAIALLASSLGVAPVTAKCNHSASWEGCSTGTIDGSDAVVSGEQSTPGTSGGTSGDRTGTPSKPGKPPSSSGSPRDRCDGTDTSPGTIELCTILRPRDGYDSPTAPAPGSALVTLSDIARFRPAAAVHRMEPDGWAVVGLPANFFGVAHPQVVSGELLGAPAEVRFSPLAFGWDYGDGTGATHGTGGATWAALGLREFDRTATSHVFGAPGTYVVRLSVVFRAEYRVGDGTFVPILGTLAVPANDLRVTAGSAATVLVDRDCARTRAGPGC